MNIVEFYVDDPNAPKPTRPAHLGANILVICKGRLLLERRWDCERWGLPGGGVKRGEAPRQCAVREMYEETGLRVAKQELIPLKFYDEPRIAAYRDGSIWRMYVKLFALHLREEPTIQLSRESLQMQFFTAEELQELDIVPTHRGMVMDYLDLLDSSVETAMSYLMQDELLHMDMIEPIRRGHGKVCYADSHGVLMLEENNHEYMLSTDSEKLAKLLLPMTDGAALIAVHHDFEERIAMDYFHFSKSHAYFQVVYPNFSQPTWGDVRQLGVEDLDIVFSNYALYENPEEVRILLEKGAVWGQYVDGQLAAFIGTHGEGAVGMLEVFKPYRRQGIGQNLIAHVAKQWQEKGNVAFAQIATDNVKSLALQEKLGTRRSETEMWWIWK